MKHKYITTHLKQKYRELSRQQLVKAVQSDQKLNSGLERLRHPYFGTRMVFWLSTILRKVKPLTATITWHYWIDWAQELRKDGLTCKRNKCCSTKTMHHATSPWKQWSNWMNQASNCFLTHRILQLWPPSDYYLFADLTKMLQGKRFGSNDEVIAETETYSESKDELSYKKCIVKFEKRWNGCITLEGNYVDE